MKVSEGPIAEGVTIGENVEIAEDVFIGTGATIIPGERHAMMR